MVSDDLFGAGVAYPVALTSSGRLATSAGEARLWESVTAILTTPQGTCALDSHYGLPPQAYEVQASAADIAWAVGRAIERSEPRAGDIQVQITRDDAQTQTVWLTVRIRPIDSQVEINRIFPFFRARGFA